MRREGLFGSGFNSHHLHHFALLRRATRCKHYFALLRGARHYTLLAVRKKAAFIIINQIIQSLRDRG